LEQRKVIFLDWRMENVIFNSQPYIRFLNLEVASHKVCKAESYSEIFEPLKAQKNFGNNFLVI